VRVEAEKRQVKNPGGIAPDSSLFISGGEKEVGKKPWEGLVDDQGRESKKIRGREVNGTPNNQLKPSGCTFTRGGGG